MAQLSMGGDGRVDGHDGNHGDVRHGSLSVRPK